MRLKFSILFLAGILSLVFHSSGQRTVVVVEPDEGYSVYWAIRNDPDPGGKIFELRRGGLYYLPNPISHEGYTLHIRAEEGDGPRPILQPAYDELGPAFSMFESSGGLILEGLYLQGRDVLFRPIRSHIRIFGSGNRFVLENVMFDYSDFSAFSVESSGNSIFMNNCQVRNQSRDHNPLLGNVLDIRSSPQDTISITNSTIYNNNGEITRLRDGFLGYLEFDHNTVWATNLLGGFNLGTTYRARVTNNIFHNFGIRASDISHDALFSLDSLHQHDDLDDSGRFFDLSNNNWYNDPVFGQIMNDHGIDTFLVDTTGGVSLPDTTWFRWVARKNVFANQHILDTSAVSSPPAIINFIESGQVDTCNIFSEPLEFMNPSPLPLSYWKFIVENNYYVHELSPPSPYVDEDPGEWGDVPPAMAFNFSYDRSSRSATAATGGLPLGDPAWVPHVPNVSGGVPLIPGTPVRAYPNPATERVMFEFWSGWYSKAMITIHDLLGREVYSSTMAVMEGNNLLTVDLGNLPGKGIYLYSVGLDTPVGYRRIGTGRILKR